MRQHRCHCSWEVEAGGFHKYLQATQWFYMNLWMDGHYVSLCMPYHCHSFLTIKRQVLAIMEWLMDDPCLIHFLNPPKVKAFVIFWLHTKSNKTSTSTMQNEASDSFWAFGSQEPRSLSSWTKKNWARLVPAWPKRIQSGEPMGCDVGETYSKICGLSTLGWLLWCAKCCFSFWFEFQCDFLRCVIISKSQRQSTIHVRIFWYFDIFVVLSYHFVGCAWKSGDSVNFFHISPFWKTGKLRSPTSHFFRGIAHLREV